MTGPLSPDMTPAVQLALHPIGELDMVDAAVTSLQRRIPEWSPREGDTEIVLIEALAIIAGQNAYALNQLPAVVLAGVLELQGVERQPAAAATCTLRFTLTTGSTTARVLPAGTRFRMPLADGSGTGDFLSTDPVTINPADGMSGFVTVRADTTGTRYSGVLANTRVQVVDPVSWIESAVTYTPTVGGSDGETDAAFFARGAAYLRSQTSALVLPKQFEAFALNRDGVFRARTVNLWNGANASSVGQDLGHVTIAVTDTTGAAPSALVLQDLLADMQSRSQAGLTLHVSGPHLIDYPVTLTVEAAPGQDKAELQTRLLSWLKGWISPAAWSWGTPVYANDVIARAGNQAGVQRVTSVTGAAVGRAVTDPIQLPAATSTLAVTVT